MTSELAVIAVWAVITAAMVGAALFAHRIPDVLAGPTDRDATEDARP